MLSLSTPLYIRVSCIYNPVALARRTRLFFEIALKPMHRLTVTSLLGELLLAFGARRPNDFRLLGPSRDDKVLPHGQTRVVPTSWMWFPSSNVEI
jgi:hypothetical protein